MSQMLEYCPICKAKMELGYISAVSSIGWSEEKPDPLFLRSEDLVGRTGSCTIEVASRCPDCKIVIFSFGTKVEREPIEQIRKEHEAEDHKLGTQGVLEEAVIMALLTATKDTSQGLTLHELEEQGRHTHPSIPVVNVINRLLRAGKIVHVDVDGISRYSMA